MATEYADFTAKQLDALVAYLADDYEIATHDGSDGAAYKRHVARTSLHGIALELNARGDAHADALVMDEVADDAVIYADLTTAGLHEHIVALVNLRDSGEQVPAWAAASLVVAVNELHGRALAYDDNRFVRGLSSC